MVLLSFAGIVWGTYGGLGVLGSGVYVVVWILFLISVAALFILRSRKLGVTGKPLSKYATWDEVIERERQLNRPLTWAEIHRDEVAATKFCRYCGAKIPRESRFCEECGTRDSC